MHMLRVRPLVEHDGDVWTLYTVKDIEALENQFSAASQSYYLASHIY